MGWVINVPGARGYEGYAQVLDTDGKVVKDRKSDQAVAERCEREGVFWRAADVAGWVSPTLHRIPEGFTGKVDPDERFMDDVLRPEWEQFVYDTVPLVHIRVLLDRIAHHKQRITKLDDELAAAVRHAMRNGSHWATIGEETGLGKQAARERWTQADEL
ncbi:hypothetical protein IEU95_06810 [Hoyosella rhizosphaerae]|uniref:Uncharacterized protein n=1 Tax=Hoyosella rhizosphaerae TaxID=1755582 RepID=A0A916XB09_9ACTN|nr:hypothetical protein [Hoyosella rhizosphaerae]MBN4926533.1 hypothetical protein [Hoyosella rhizosphaerae]GGC58528.1 hypothetical protein GCM10011410_08770 [Hoyosella rhizosphaerae]